MPGPEGLVLGEGHHLPDATILADFNFYGPRLSETVWEHPDHPDIVLRLQRDLPGTDDACWQLARLGISHLLELQDCGIQMPAQRLVLGPDVYRNSRLSRLWSITERIQGRALTYKQADAQHAETVISGTSDYLLRRVKDPNRQGFLFDVSYPWQYTVRKNENDCMLHDTGFEFALFSNSVTQDTLRSRAVNLERWARHVSIDQPDTLRELVRRAESSRMRLIRIGHELIKPSLTLPQEPPPRNLY